MSKSTHTMDNSLPHNYIDIHHALTTVANYIFDNGGIPMTGTYFGGSPKSRTRSVDDLTSKYSPLLAKHFISTFIESKEVIDITEPKPMLRVKIVFRFQLVGTDSYILVPGIGQSAQPHKDTAIVTASSYALKNVLLSMLGLNAGSTDDVDVQGYPIEQSPARVGNKNSLTQVHWEEAPEVNESKDEPSEKEKLFIKRVNQGINGLTSTEDLRTYYEQVKNELTLFSDKTKAKIKNRFQERKTEIGG